MPGILRAQRQPLRPLQLDGEYLNPVIATVGHVDLPRLIHRHATAMRRHKLTLIAAH